MTWVPTPPRAHILLTSFKKSVALPYHVNRLSVAVYQPAGFNYPKLDFFDIRNNGKWTRPRDFVHMAEPLREYREALRRLYAFRSDAITQWCQEITEKGGWYALCCWCPFDHAAQRQIKEHGSFICHTEIIRLVLHGMDVLVDWDRLHLMKDLTNI